MPGFLQLVILALTAGITFVREIRGLHGDIMGSLSNQRPLFIPEPRGRTAPFFVTVEAEPGPETITVSTSKERDMIEFQIEIEKLFHKNQLIPRIKSEFKAEEGLEQHLRKLGINVDFAFDLLTQMVLHKRAQLPVLVGILRRHFAGHENASQLTADELLKCAEANLVDWNPATRQFIIRFEITPDVQAEIDRYQYPLPMVIPPKELRRNTDTGYLTAKGSVILKDNHHEEDVCLDHLNRMNKIRLKLDMDTATTIQNSWRHLDKPKPDEDPKEFQKRVKAFEKYSRTAHDVLLHLGISSGGEFHLTHRYDKRGRTYCQGYHVTYQGPTWNKACIQFADEECVE